MHKSKKHMTCRGGVRARRSAAAILADLITQIFADRNEPVIIAVGGPGGTGKSTFSTALAKTLPDSTILTLDDYKTPRAERQKLNLLGAHPSANQMELILLHLSHIRNGREFDRPVYNAVTGEANATEPFTPKRFTILDGEISTYRHFRDHVDFAIFVDSDWKTQLNTRVSRDIEVRQYSREKAIATFLQSNLREFSAHGAESKNWADVHLFCHDDYRLEIESVSQEVFDSFESLLARDLDEVDLSGLVVAVPTPFTETNTIDREKFIEHLEHLAQVGVHRILVNGTTGEFFSLTSRERRLVFKLARQYFPGMVLYQAGCNSLEQTCQEAQWGEDYGADAILVLPPSYPANLSAEGLIRYFKTVGGKLDCPLILYNFPQNTRNPITCEILASVPHFGMKDSSADLSLVSATPRYYVGGDTKIVEAYRSGAFGFVSGHANVCPRLFVEMESAIRSGEAGHRDKIQRRITQLISALPFDLIAAAKYAISRQIPGYSGSVRSPLIPLADTQRAEIDRCLAEFVGDQGQ